MPLACRSMDFRGATKEGAVGGRLTIKYNEGGADLVEYPGVVTWAEAARRARCDGPRRARPPATSANTPAALGRMYVCFDNFPEAEGAWVDDNDEWCWRNEEPAPVPEPVPVPGGWVRGLVAGPIDKIFLRRSMDGVATDFFVKWKALAHLHSQWVPQNELEVDHGNKQRVQRYLKATSASGAPGMENTWELGGEQEGEAGARLDDGQPYNPDFNSVERILAMQNSEEDTPPSFLVKWKSLPYASATWESARTLLGEQRAIRRYRTFEAAPTAAERRMTSQAARPPATHFRKLAESPAFTGGHALRDYQLEGLNWLLFSWYTRRSVMLADEMGLGKTIQSVATLNHLWKHEHVRGPFLVIAPLSTLSHWQREFEQWTEMNAIVYHGSAESRETIRDFEFFYADAQTNPATRGLYKFQALITSYEVVKQDLDKMRRIPWRYMVVDEAHRLKNKDSALANDLRTLQVEHMHLLSGTPLQNNTTELWALLSFLDASLFPSLDAFLADFGTLTDAAQIAQLNEKIRPYLLRRQKNDVEKAIAPLEETIIWVEMTLFQKRTYRAVLEGNRELLVQGAATAALPSLVNIQMEMRKCCNHPYLIKGVEASHFATGDAAGPSAEAGDPATELLLKASGKYVLLDKLLPKLKAEGHRVLIFSQMVRMLDILSDYLRERRYSHERLDGSIRGDLRQAAIDRFCRPGSDTFIFLLSTRAGGLGINLTAADTCIIMDSDWNPQNDVQAMARSHRIGQSKRVKVFRLVTANTYESEMVERANKKLGLERAMNADRGNDGLRDGGGGRRDGPTQDRAEIDAMLKRGAHDIFMEDDSAFQKFNQADIDEILKSSSTKISYDKTDEASGSVFSKAAFIADENEVDMDDPEFWTKILPELEKKDAELAEYLLKRKTKVVKRLGMAEDGELEAELRESERKPNAGGKSHSKQPSKSQEEIDARRRERRSEQKVWSKTERMNCERALLSFGMGRWNRIIQSAQGGTKLRTEEEVALFGFAFICLCVGVPIGSVGQLTGGASAAEADGIVKARELLMQMGCSLPQLSEQQVEELEPLVSAGGAEYAERVHKLGASMMAKLLSLKQLADSIERTPDPLLTYVAPPVRGGVGRPPSVRWTAHDDALLLLGVYKHGLRAYEEVRDDPELPFSCMRGGWVLPPPVQPAKGSSGAGGFGNLDELPLPRPGSTAAKRQRVEVESSVPAAPTFLQKKDYDERLKALVEALQEGERQRAEQMAWEGEWEAELRAHAGHDAMTE